MSIAQELASGWHRFLTAFHTNAQHTLLATLGDVYRAEVVTVARCTEHAEKVHYPQFRVELLRIAAEMQGHVPWLHAQILALGGNIPLLSSAPPLERNSWECLRREVEEARRGCVRLLECIHLAEREKPELAVGLHRLRQDKLRHREDLRHLQMKSDPYNLSMRGQMGLLSAGETGQKRVWFEQRKNSWLDRQRTLWVVEGKLAPSSEWSGEQEVRWTVELSSREREWERGPSEQKAATAH